MQNKKRKGRPKPFSTYDCYRKAFYHTDNELEKIADASNGKENLWNQIVEKAIAEGNR